MGGVERVQGTGLEWEIGWLPTLLPQLSGWRPLLVTLGQTKPKNWLLQGARKTGYMQGFVTHLIIIVED